MLNTPIEVCGGVKKMTPLPCTVLMQGLMNKLKKIKIKIQMQLFQTIRNTLEIIAKSYFCVEVGSWVQILARVIEYINIFVL
jgi:hypothetical protein